MSKLVLLPYVPVLRLNGVAAAQGKTWSEPMPVGILSGACARLHMLQDGRALMTYGRRLPPYGLYASLSRDGGLTWDKPLLLRSAPDGNQG